MPDAGEMLAAARTLAAGSTAVPPDAHLRRAVSTAYYALFHKVLSAAADRFAGKAAVGQAVYAIIYRAFDHGHMRTTCAALDVAVLRDALKQQLLRDAVSPDAREFASMFLILQGARHHADYDPRPVFRAAEASAWIDMAEAAIAAFDRIPPDEQADILALLMVRARA